MRQEIAHLRTIGDKKARQEYLHRVGDEVMGRIKERHGTTEIGFHYNLHGGQSPDYIEAGGIRATRGDIMAGMSVTPNPSSLNDKVYFFSSAGENLFDILDVGHPAIFIFGSRMGHVLIPFRLDSDYLRTAFAEGGAFNRTAISIDFDPRWVRAHNHGKKIGIPASTFLTPPLSVFVGVRERLGLPRLSRDEETFAVMRYLEAAATWPPAEAGAPAEAASPAGETPAADAPSPGSAGAPPPPPESSQLTPFRGSLDLYHTTAVAEGRDILAHGFVASQISADGTTKEVFYPAGYTGAPVTIETKDFIPEGGSGIYFGLSGDDIWRGNGFGLWNLQWEGGFEIRVHVPVDNGLHIVDLRDPQNRSYAMQWARDHHTGWPLSEKAVDQFAAEHDIDILIRRGQTGRESYTEVVFKSSRAYAYLNQLPREGHEPSSFGEDEDED